MTESLINDVDGITSWLCSWIYTNPAENTFANFYEEGKKLGEGAFSVVKVGISRKNSKTYAVKIVTKAKLDEEDEVALHDEIHILKSLHHKNIIRLYEVFDEPAYYYLVTERMKGGELFDRIVEKEFYTEKEARDVSKILFGAIAYCHSKKIVHRDLKPENLLLVEKHNDILLKIADFGFAKKQDIENSLHTQCGTPGYVAPEILTGRKYGSQVDNWSLGVIIYILMGGYPPFDAPKRRDMFRKARKAEYEFHRKYWKNVSKEAQDLIRRLLTLDTRKRLTAKNALRHPWIQGENHLLAEQDLSANLKRLKEFNATRKFKAAVNAVIVVNKFESLGPNLRDDLNDVLSEMYDDLCS